MQVISNSKKILFVTCNKGHHNRLHRVTCASLNSIFMKKIQIRFTHYQQHCYRHKLQGEHRELTVGGNVIQCNTITLTK